MQLWKLNVGDVFRWRATKISSWHLYRVVQTLPDVRCQEMLIDGQWGNVHRWNEYAYVERRDSNGVFTSES